MDNPELLDSLFREAVSAIDAGDVTTLERLLAGFGLVYLHYVLAPPLPGLFATQVLRGVAFAAFTAAALTLAIDLAPPAPPEARGRAAGLFASAQGLAQISGNRVGGPLAAALGFRALFALAAVTVLCGAVYSYRVLAHPRPAERTN